MQNCKLATQAKLLLPNIVLRKLHYYYSFYTSLSHASFLGTKIQPCYTRIMITYLIRKRTPRINMHVLESRSQNQCWTDKHVI